MTPIPQSSLRREDSSSGELHPGDVEMDATTMLLSSLFFRLAPSPTTALLMSLAPSYDTANIGGVVAMPNWLQTFGESRRRQGTCDRTRG